jgi:hypothetical protein
VGLVEVSRFSALVHRRLRTSVSEDLFFFGHLLSRFNHLEASGHQQATPSVVTSPIDLSDALEAFLELDLTTSVIDLLWDDSTSSSSTTVRSFDLTSAIRDHSSKVEM